MIGGDADATRIKARCLSFNGTQSADPVLDLHLNAVNDGWRVLRTILAEHYYRRQRMAASKTRIQGSAASSATSYA
jgi:hypothetical protein